MTKLDDLVAEVQRRRRGPEEEMLEIAIGSLRNPFLSEDPGAARRHVEGTLRFLRSLPVRNNPYTAKTSEEVAELILNRLVNESNGTARTP